VKTEKGFTLIEITITIAILTILFSVGAIALSKLQSSLASSASDRQILFILSSAARKARHGALGTNWGVYIPYDPATRSTSTITVFSGTSYATRNPVNDVLYTVNNNILFPYVDFSGAAANTGNDHEIVFNVLNGSTSNYGSINLKWYNSTRTLIIDPDGFSVRQ